MATTIFFNGRITSQPGAYSYVDASGLESVGLSASGIVAVLGTCEGGIPYTAFKSTADIPRLTSPSQIAAFCKSGDLYEVSSMLFAPSTDPNIPGGAQQVIPIKVNPATPATATFSGSGVPVLTLTSKDWGAFTSQINVTFSTATNGTGKLLTIQFENVTESADNLGGTAIANLQYNGTGNGWATMAAGVQTGGSVYANGTRTVVGTPTAITQPTAPSVLTVTGEAAAGRNVVVYGFKADGSAVREVVPFTAAPATSVTSFASVAGVHVNQAPTGSVVISAGQTTCATLTSGTQSLGMVLWSYGYVANSPVTFQSSASGKVIIEGKNANGALVTEAVTLAGNTVTTTNSYSLINYLAVGGMAASNVVVSAQAAKSLAAVNSTIASIDGFFAGKSATVNGTLYGFDFTVSTTQQNYPAASLDATTADVDALASGDGLDLTGNLAAVVTWINNNSQLVTAAPVGGASGAPDNTGGAVFLSGGGEGAPNFTDWQNALNWLKRIRVNSVVPMTADPAVASAVDAHCAFMCGVGRSERDAFVGVMNADLTDVPTLTQALAATRALNSKNVRACPQGISRYNSAGVLTQFTPPFAAALAAGMQAGSDVGTPLTHKYLNAVGFRQHSSWNPIDNADQLIQGGALIMEQVDGSGLRWVRNVTTYLQDNNIAFVEGSVNQAVNFATYTFRTAMEFAVGRPGFAGTINAARGVAITQLGLLVDAGVLVTWRSLDIQLNLDVMQISVEMAPVLPINFVPITIHLVTVSQSGTPVAA